MPFIQWVIEYVAAVHDLGMSSGSEKLSPNARRICAVLLSPMDPKIQNVNELGRKPKTEVPLESFYREGGQREYERQSWPTSLQKSMTLAHDANRALIREKRRHDETIQKQQRTLDKQWIWIRILSGAAAGAWALLGAVITLLFRGI